MKKIVIADDHPMIRGALALSLAATTAFGAIEILETATLEELFQLLAECGEAGLVLLDLRMPGVNGFEGLLSLRARFRHAGGHHFGPRRPEPRRRGAAAGCCRIHPE